MRLRLLIAAVFGFTLLTTSSIGQQGAATPEPAQLTTLPASVLEVELKSARGGPFKLSDYSDRVLVLNLWATWCSPCVMETPALVRMQSRFWSRGVRVVGLTAEDPQDSAKQVVDWVRLFRVQYKIGWMTADFNKSLVKDGRDVLPQTIMILRSGRIVRHFVGFDPKKTPGLLEEAIEEALKEIAEVQAHEVSTTSR
jgi:thiol-disulfide isomerase/thioredoxin